MAAKTFDPSGKGLVAEVGTLADAQQQSGALAPSAAAKLNAAIDRAVQGKK